MQVSSLGSRLWGSECPASDLMAYAMMLGKEVPMGSEQASADKGGKRKQKATPCEQSIKKVRVKGQSKGRNGNGNSKKATRKEGK